MSSTLAKPPSHPQPSSRASTNSSVLTAQRVTIPPSRNASRPPITGLRPKTPPAATGTKRALSPVSKIRKNSIPSRSNSVSGITEGIGNLNRWSQSTVSSKSSSINHNRSNGFARRLSGSFSSLGPFSNPQPPPPNKHVLKSSLTSPISSPSRSVPRTPPRPSAAAPKSITLSALSQAVETGPTPAPEEATPATPETLATYMPGAVGYFGENWASSSPPKKRSQDERLASVSSSARGSPNRINPGAKNSFAKTLSNSAGSPHHARGPSLNGKRQERDLPSRPINYRNHGHRGSVGQEGERSLTSPTGYGDRSRRRRAPSQKAMLSNALQKANHAVVLDHAQNFEGAMDAYGDACDLLQQVMLRSSGDEDRKKLEAIRNTYKNRINELQSNELQMSHANDKALPDVPMNFDNKDPDPFSPVTDEEDDDVGSIRMATTIQENSRFPDRNPPVTLTREQLPPRRQSLMPFTRAEEENVPSKGIGRLSELPASSPLEVLKDVSVEGKTLLPPAMNKDYLPRPLSPRRPLTPAAEVEYSASGPPPTQIPEGPPARPPNPSTTRASFVMPRQPYHVRQDTVETTSWLDTLGESGGSSASSMHSRTQSRSSFIGRQRKHSRLGSGATEAEFDAALDAAVEAAYDDGFEPADSPTDEMAEQPLSFGHDRITSDVRRKVELAKQRSRELEREAIIAAAKEREKNRLLEKARARARSDSIDLEYDDEEAEEEERILEEMTRDYIMDDTEFDVQSKSALPRQSDSSGFSGRTWGSIGSNPATAGTSLSTVIESISSNLPPQVDKQPPLPALPAGAGFLPPQAIGSGPALTTSTSSSSLSKQPSLAVNTSVRERRLSGRKVVEQLKIDTTAKMSGSAPKPPPASTKPAAALPTQTNGEASVSATPQEGQKTVQAPAIKSAGMLSSNRQMPSPFPNPSPLEPMSGISPGMKIPSQLGSDKDNQLPAVPSSPSRTLARRPGSLRKNFSSSSLKSLRQPLTTPTATDDSPSTPLSKVFSNSSSQQQRSGSVPSVPELPTPTTAYFAARGTLPIGTLSFFDTDVHAPGSPGSPNPLAPNTPLPLEACPESFLLRPFWLLRCIFNTLSHTRGGYISSRLFVPRDIWRVRNVKLKNVEEKVMNCDLLTAALLKLAKVDTYDADAVLEEMQSFEAVMDQVQALLTKKLGTEVGVQGSAALFRASANAEETSASSETLASKSTNTSSLWRKLRPKTSLGPGVPSSMAGTQKEGVKETATLSSLPMTTLMNPRLPKRDVSKVKGIGPNATYMASLARLCDAAQVLDQIARQVEDPGLKYSSQTHVGLELSARHASEFFAFYICRFILTDVGMMLDKSIKRWSEWVLA